MVALATSRTTGIWFHPKIAFTITTKPQQENRAQNQHLANNCILCLIFWSSKNVLLERGTRNEKKKKKPEWMCL